MLDRYITMRKGSSLWQLRLPVPRPLQSVVGRKEVTKSLETSDKSIAERRAAKLVVAQHAEWDALRRDEAAFAATSALPLDPDEGDMLDEAHRAAFRLLNKNLDRRREAHKGTDGVTWSEFRRGRTDRLALWEQRFATGDWTEWERIADRLIQLRRWNLKQDGEKYDRLVRMIAENFLDGYRAALARDEALPDPDPLHPHTKLARERQSGSGGKSISDLLDQYCTIRLVEGKREDTIAQDRKVIELFADFVGARRSVSSITPHDALEFRNTIARLPTSIGKRNAYSGLTIRQAAAKADSEGEVRLSATTVSKYLSTISPFFRWLNKDLHVSSNVFDGLHVKAAQQNPRPPFTTEQLNTLLKSPLFVGFRRDGKEHEPGESRIRDWRFWIPMLCMFTGARIGEIAQLRVEDLSEQHGSWFITLREEPTKGQRIKNRRLRVVAIHSTLVRIGFVAYAETVAGRSNVGPLFPDLQTNNRGQAGRASRFFRDYLRKIGLKDGRDGLGSHSFRHTMADELRLADYLDHEAGPLVLGHTDRGTKTTAGYGRISQGTAERLRRMMEDVRFNGVDFTHLFLTNHRTEAG